MLEGHRPGPIDLNTFQSSVSIPTLENFYFYSRKIWIIDFSFHSRNSRPEFQISHSTLEIRDQNFTFLFLLLKFEIRISYFSFYSRNSRPEFQISLSTLEIRDQNFKFLFLLSNLLFLTLVNAWSQGVPEEELRSVFKGKVARNNGLKNGFFQFLKYRVHFRDICQKPPENGRAGWKSPHWKTVK